ncbi:MAG: arsenite methyltransferase [Bacteroidetes bacterium]|nr:arsenite methyltransferase [Bacteroidota bacterium]MBT7093749.1 arsenite methyltransferase [Bacteroidota bacterium]
MKNSEQIKSKVREKYSQIVEDEGVGCGCACGCGPDITSDSESDYSIFSENYENLDGYNPDADLSLGCGIPTEFAGIKAAHTVVDLGSGAGNDCFVARSIVGEKGEVIGVDMTREMIKKARDNAKKTGYKNVKFRLGEIENLPVTSNKADVVISNCVLNLVPDKHAAFNEIIRVLKPGGHFTISDVVTRGQIPEKLREQAELYAGCVAGAIEKEDYLSIIRDTGFLDIQVHKEKPVEMPDSLVKSFLSDEEFKIYQSADLGIFSMTVSAMKPKSCC